MSETFGCHDNHTGTDLLWRVGLATAADQGDQFYVWEGAYHTTVAYQP